MKLCRTSMSRLDMAVTKAIAMVKELKQKGIGDNLIIEKLQDVEDPILKRLIIAEGLGYSFLGEV